MNIGNENLLKYYFLSFLAIIIISFFVLFPSFKLAFQDEEWQGIVLPKTIYSSYVTTRLTSYSSPMWFMTNLYSFLGPNFYPFFILSFILRNILAFNVLVFLYIVTKNRLASFIGGILVAVGFSGIQNTVETINLISYVSFVGVLVFLSFFFLAQQISSFKLLTGMSLSLIFSTILASFRVYPLYIWVFLAESFELLSKFNKEILKVYLKRLSIISVVFLFLYKIGIFSWYTRDSTSNQRGSDVGRFVSDTVSLFASLNFTIVQNFLKGLGSIIFPDIIDKSGYTSFILGLSYVIIFIYLIYSRIKRPSQYINILFNFSLWPLLFYSCYFLVYINGFVIKDTAIFSSNIRYQLFPFVGFCITLSIFLSKVFEKENRQSEILKSFVLAFIAVHALTTYIYLNNLSKQRDGFYMVRIWDQIKQLMPESSLNTKKKNIFYFETDGAPRTIYAVNDGFIGHMIATYKIQKGKSMQSPAEVSYFGSLITPPVLDFDQLVSYVQNGLPDDPIPVTWDRIFALRVDGDKVTDIKEDVKKRVEVDLNK